MQLVEALANKSDDLGSILTLHPQAPQVEGENQLQEAVQLWGVCVCVPAYTQITKRKRSVEQLPHADSSTLPDIAHTLVKLTHSLQQQQK